VLAHQVLRSRLPLRRIGQGPAGELAHFAQAGFDQVHAFLQRSGQRRARAVEHHAAALQACDAGQSRIKIIGHAGWQAAAGHDPARWCGLLGHRV
jgi:hypothetical protein